MTGKEATEYFKRKAQKEEIRAMVTSGDEKKNHLLNAVKFLDMAKRIAGVGVETAAFTSGGTIRR